MLSLKANVRSLAEIAANPASHGSRTGRRALQATALDLLPRGSRELTLNVVGYGSFRAVPKASRLKSLSAVLEVAASMHHRADAGSASYAISKRKSES